MSLASKFKLVRSAPAVMPNSMQEDTVFKKLEARDPTAPASVGDVAAGHRSGAEHLRRVAQRSKVYWRIGKSYGKRRSPHGGRLFPP